MTFSLSYLRDQAFGTVCWLIATSISILLTISLVTNVKAANTRISTGKDLYEACKVLSEFALNPQGRTPKQGLYCRQYLSGYFTSLRYRTQGSGDGNVTGAPIFEADCITISGPRSYEQLANRVVVNSEWHPELMGEPAVRLVEAVFGGRPPCR